jgi:tRNA-specific adenosine deaminase 3
MSSSTDDHHEQQPFQHPDSSSFIEIRPPPQTPKLPDLVQVYITRVKPQQCGQLIKDLQRMTSHHRSESIAHLKRVRNVPSSTTTNSPLQKKLKSETALQVLLGAVDDSCQDDWSDVLKTYDASLETCWLPGRPAQSKKELEEFSKQWPTIYFHKKSDQHKQEQLSLTKEEIDEMTRGLSFAIDDAKQAMQLMNDNDNGKLCTSGAVIMCPVSHTVVATANKERVQQQAPGEPLPDAMNPLCTSVLLAIQGVSRKERAAAVGYGMDSETFQKGQYLCTGYDVYTTREPGVFEAMALVHSRIRRVVFGIPNEKDGGLGGTGMETAVQALPTNHHYRVFCCASNSKLSKECNKIDSVAGDR